MRSGGPLFSFRAVPVITGMLAERGIDVRGLLQEAGLPEDAAVGDVTAPLGRIQELLDLAATALGSPTFGIDLAENLPSGIMGFTEFLMRAAPTVGRGMALLCEFAALINPILRFRLDAGVETTRLHLAIASSRDALGKHLNEYTFALMFRQFSTVLGSRWPVEQLWFPHRRDADAAIVSTRFGCPIEFGARDCGVAIKNQYLEHEPPTADPVLFEFLLAQARARLGDLNTPDVISQVAQMIETRLPGDVRVEAVSSAMAMTVRSLQRHLADAGTSYREVLVHVRRRRRAELSRGNLDDGEIAKRLGFSDAKAMRRSLDD